VAKCGRLLNPIEAPREAKKTALAGGICHQPALALSIWSRAADPAALPGSIYYRLALASGLVLASRRQQTENIDLAPAAQGD
jgi:hypothetical protein